MAVSSLPAIIPPQETLACTQCLGVHFPPSKVERLKTNQVSMIKLSYRVTAKSHLGAAWLPTAQTHTTWRDCLTCHLTGQQW